MPLLLLHGALGSRDQLDPLAALITRRRPVLQMEFEGHGTTPGHGTAFTIDGFVRNVVAALDTAGVDKADVFGYSMGGYVALAFALAHPGRVTTITTLGTKFDWTPGIARDAAAFLDAGTLRAKAPAFTDTLRARHAGAGGWEGMLQRTAAFLTRLGEHAPLDEDALARIHHRVRIMVGDRDRDVSVEESAAAYRRLPSGELMVLPRTPHPIEQVDVYRLADVLIELTS